ncbi:uncharacterized protein [Nicotiana tomentosiformis]|uniref:uncharacterized protein n=1 Tax=Nicotiana tomentosiformis TaxID=4098 RepID=UPI00388CE138
MTRKFLDKYFSLAKTGTFRREIHNFCHKDNETVFEAWERFKEIVRKCQHSGIELWMQLQDFWDGLTPASRRTLSNAAGGLLMKKTPEEIVTILDELSEDANQWPSTSAERRRANGVHPVDANTYVQSELEDLMKSFIVKTDEILDAHADTERNPKETVNAVTLRSRQVLEDPTSVQKESVPEKEIGEQLKSEVDKKKTGKKGADKKKKEDTSRRGESNKESKHIPALPFPQKLYRENLDEQFERFLSMLRQVNENFPFTEVLSQMPSYAKFLKDILTKKRKVEETSVVKLTEHCSAILQNKLPQKCGDPGSFTIPCSLGSIKFDKSLCDSGGSINLMPLSIYRKLKSETGEIRSVPISLQLADQTTLIPEGVVENILVRVDKFVFPMKFIVVNMEENKEVPLILGRPFLATGREILDIHDRKLMLRVGEETKLFR